MALNASLYWIDEPADVSFGRVYEYLVGRGYEADRDHTGAERVHLVRVGQGRDKGAGRRERASEKTPYGILVYYDWISKDARAHGDHPAIDIDWGSGVVDAPDAAEHEEKQAALRDYRFFLDVCKALCPLYAQLAVYDFVPCAYDVLHGKSGTPGSLYASDRLLAGEGARFWRTYAYTEPVGEGTYGTDWLLWSPRRGMAQPVSKGDAATRREVWREAVHRAWRAQHGG